jgi:hypothetical protein
MGQTSYEVLRKELGTPSLIERVVMALSNLYRLYWSGMYR